MSYDVYFYFYFFNLKYSLTRTYIVAKKTEEVVDYRKRSQSILCLTSSRTQTELPHQCSFQGIFSLEFMPVV